ncbi:MAG: glycosyltransferase family 1 protein [Pyrinomonadaceae bacterium]
MSDKRNLKVGFWLGDVSLQHGGISPYALRILDSLLVGNEPGWTFALLCAEGSLRDVRQIRKDLYNQIVEIYPVPAPQINRNLWLQRIQRFGLRESLESTVNSGASFHQKHLKKWIDDLNLDLIHFPTPSPPFPVGEHVPYVVPTLLDVQVPYIVTIHDVQEIHFPEYFSPAQRAIRAMHKWQTLDRAGKIIVSFGHVKEDLIKYFNLPESKIHVCPIPFNSISLQAPTPAAARKYNERYAAWVPFLLYPAQTWRHKNHALLFEALQSVQRQGQKNLRLVCTGGKNDYYPALEAQLDKLLLRDSVLFTGIVAEDELSWLYRNAAAVTIPTEYEAGSFPLFEAIKQGVPVVCSDVTSLPETIGNRRFVFNPHDAQTLAELILRIVSDARFREENIANSIKQAERLSGINAAAYFYAAYRSLLGY